MLLCECLSLSSKAFCQKVNCTVESATDSPGWISICAAVWRGTVLFTSSFNLLAIFQYRYLPICFPSESICFARVIGSMLLSQATKEKGCHQQMWVSLWLLYSHFNLQSWSIKSRLKHIRVRASQQVKHLEFSYSRKTIVLQASQAAWRSLHSVF